MNPPFTTYRANQRHDHGFFQTWRLMANNIVTSRSLIWQLFKRDFLASYRKSFLGLTWIFISPVLGIVSWVFLQMTGMLRPGETGVPYPIYVLIGTSMWGLFMGFYESASQTLSAGRGLIFHVNYPHEALLFKQIAQFMAAFLIQFAMNLVMLAVFGVRPSLGIMLLPLVALPLFFLGGAIGLIDSMISIVAVDVHKFIGIVLGLWMWLTPVVYSDEIDQPLVQALMRWNPLTYLVCSARDVMLEGRLYHPLGYAISAGVSLFVFMLSWRLFYVSEGKVIERMV